MHTYIPLVLHEVFASCPNLTDSSSLSLIFLCSMKIRYPKLEEIFHFSESVYIFICITYSFFPLIMLIPTSAL